MKCSFCGSTETRVIDSRECENDTVTRRRRECMKCQKRFTSYERVEMVPLMIIKKDGTRTQFNPKKIESGLLKACEKRPVSYEQITELIASIEQDLRQMPKTEIESSKVGQLVLEKLKDLDKVAYIRFASVYMEFADISSFEDVLSQLKK